VALSMQHETLAYLTGQSAKSNEICRIECTFDHICSAVNYRQNFQKYLNIAAMAVWQSEAMRRRFTNLAVQARAANKPRQGHRWTARGWATMAQWQMQTARSDEPKCNWPNAGRPSTRKERLMVRKPPGWKPRKKPSPKPHPKPPRPSRLPRGIR
jgi:hypothetical protein